MKPVDHVRWHVHEGHDHLFHRATQIVVFLCCLTARHQDARGRESSACVFADKAETLELYISILGFDKIREPYSLGLGFTSCCSREQFWPGRRSATARNKRDRNREREREERWFCSLLFTASIVRNRPLPRKSRNLVMKETVPSSPLLTRIKSFTDAWTTLVARGSRRIATVAHESIRTRTETSRNVCYVSYMRDFKILLVEYNEKRLFDYIIDYISQIWNEVWYTRYITNIVTKSNYRDCIDQIWNLKFEISSPI